MKIGLLTPSLYMDVAHHGGRIFAPGDLARHLVVGLKKRGHTVVWFSAQEDPHGAKLVAGDANLLEKNLQVRVFQDISAEYRDKMSLYGTKMYYELDLVSRAYSAAAKGEIDLVHNFHSFGYFAHFFQELTGVSTLYTLHDPVPTPDMLERWLFDRFPTHKYISLSNHQRGSLADHFIDTVYNGIDMKQFPFDAAAGDRLVAVGRMVSVKGHDVALQAARMAGVGITIATWMNENVERSDYYKDKIAPFVDGKEVIVNSLMQGESLASVYQKAKALIFPIQWEEPFGLVMVEAMACGTPVIAYNRGSVPEIVKDGVTGFIIDDDRGDTGDRGDWVIKKRGVAGLVEAIARIGEIDRAACRKHVEENFTTEQMVLGYEKVYEKILQKK